MYPYFRELIWSQFSFVRLTDSPEKLANDQEIQGFAKQLNLAHIKVPESVNFLHHFLICPIEDGIAGPHAGCWS